MSSANFDCSIHSNNLFIIVTINYMWLLIIIVVIMFVNIIIIMLNNNIVPFTVSILVCVATIH